MLRFPLLGMSYGLHLNDFIAFQTGGHDGIGPFGPLPVIVIPDLLHKDKSEFHVIQIISVKMILKKC